MRETGLILTADPGRAREAHAAAIDEAIGRVLRSGRYILGPEVEAFEREWAAWLGAAHAVGVASGTDAIELALRAVGVAPGDVVVTVGNTVGATATAIERAGARLALVDLAPGRFTLDVAGLAAWLDGDAPPVRAVVPVHLYGEPADLPALLDLASQHGFAVVEDAAQAHGALLEGRPAGTWGAAGAFSFYPTKNLGALGDGGAVVTSDAGLAARVRGLRQYGWSERYVSDVPGTNSRLDEMQAAILRARLGALRAENMRRGLIATRYGAALATVPGLALPAAAPGAVSAWHQYVVRHAQRDALRAHLAERGIQAGVLYPVPIHHQPAWRGRVLLPPGGLPETERACREVLSLPVHPHLGDDEVDRVIAAVCSFQG